MDVDFPTLASPSIDTLTDDGTVTGTPKIKDLIFGFSENTASGTGGNVNYGELDNAAYSNVSSSNDNRAESEDPGFGDTVAFWAEFDIAETPANITKIEVTLEGYQGGVPTPGRNGWLGIWVPDAPTPYWKVLESSQHTSDHAYSGTLTTDLPDYIDGSDKLRIIFYNEDQSDPVFVDNVNIDITYSAFVAPPAILSAVEDDIDNRDRILSAGDTFTLTFDKSTNAPPVATKADIDGLLQFPTSVDINSIVYDHILGANYSGSWATTTFPNDTLVITVLNGMVILANKDVPLSKNDMIQIKADGVNDLKDGTGTSDPSASSSVITGNWGLRPYDDVTYGSDHNLNAWINEVTLEDEYFYNHATPYRNRGDLTYVGYLPFATYAIGRKPEDGFVYSGENDVTGTPDALKFGWMNPEKNETDGQAPDGYDPATPGNPFARGVIGTLGPGVLEFYRLVYTAANVLYGASNNNKLYHVYDTVQPVPPGAHGSSTNLAGDPICTMMADPADPAPLQLTTDGSADFAFDSTGKLFLISHDILYWVETGPPVGGVFTGPCTAHAIGDTTLTNISGLAFTKGGIIHASTFLPTNRKLHTVDPETGNPSYSSAFIPQEEIYDLGSSPKWTDINIVKSNGGLDFVPGHNATYTLTVNNIADILNPNLSGAGGPIYVEDTLPAGLTYVSASGVDWNCDHVGQLINCENPNNLPKGASLPPISLTVFVEDNAVDPNPPYEAPEPLITNNACVFSTTFEAFNVQDCDTEPTPVGLPSVSITKTPSDAIVNPGQIGLVYTLRLRNSRTITGTNITVTDPINEAPLNAYLENLRNVTATGCGHPAETTIKVKGTELRSWENPAPANIVIDGTTISVDIPDGASNGVIASTIASAINANGTHHAIADADVVSIFHGTYNLTSNGKIVNTSALIAAVDAADITDNDTEMPVPNFSGATVTADNSTPTKVQIDNIEISPYGRSVQECVIEYMVDVKDGIAGDTIIHNRADATAPLEGGSATFAVADVTVSNSPILSPVKTDDDVDNIVMPGQTVTYNLTVSNIGNLTGTGINVDDTLDTNLENLAVTSLTNCGGVYVDSSVANPPVLDINGIQVTTVNNCVISFTADVKLATGGGTIIPNTAYISAPIEGGILTQADSDDLVVAGSPALVGTKVHDKGGSIPPNEVAPGELVTYTLTIDNIGDVNGTGISVDDALDTEFENLNVISLTNCGGAYANTSTANPPVINIDGVQVTTALNCVIVFQVNVKMATLPGTVIPNTAAVSPAVEGGPGDPDVPSIDLHVPGIVNITTSKADNDADNFVDPSQIVTYTVTLENTGAIRLTGIHVLDTMDSDLENLSVLSITNCGSNYFDQSSANPPQLDIRGAGGDPLKGIDINIGASCVITFSARVKAGILSNALIPNVATISASREGAPATNPASDVLRVSMPAVSATKADNDVDNFVLRGQTVTYTINLINSGTGTRAAKGVDLFDAMDSDLENLNVTSVTNCGGVYVDGSTANPPVIDIDNVEIANGTNCVVVVTADVKATTPGGSTIPNTVLFSASDEGAPGGAAASDLLIVAIVCGDGRLEGAEICDDGNLVNGDGCEATCTLTPAPPPPPTTCGNGILEAGEQCDDGNNISEDGCSERCLVEQQKCSENCIPPLPPPPPPVSNVCLIYDPERPLEFIDLTANANATQYILALKNTKIIKQGDYVVSGMNNHSTGKQQKHFRSGIWNYEPERNTTRLEAVKSFLVSNCIPIEDDIPVPADGFRYKDVPVDAPASDELMNFTSRVFYTAYKWGIVTANEDGMANPFKDVSLAEAVAIGLRTSSALTKPYLSIQSPWYGKYMAFAKDNGILYGINANPDSNLLRDDFARIILRIMWLNPRPKVSKYAQQFDFMKDWNKNWKPAIDPKKEDARKVTDELQNIPITEDIENAEELKNTDIENLINEEDLHETAPPESCFAYKPGRNLDFDDVPKDHWANQYIEILRTTEIKNNGDYIASGYGNPSTGKDNSKYGSGSWEYRPYKPVTFLELVKVALISNCIPIDNMIIPPEDNFQFRQLPWDTSPSDEAQYFAARVMYTAYRYGLVKGDVYPFISISRFQALAILSRASDILPKTYVPKPLPFKDTADTAWYSPYLSYLHEKGLIKGFDDGTFKGNEDLKRDEMAKFVTLFMKFNSNPEIRKFGEYMASFIK